MIRNMLLAVLCFLPAAAGAGPAMEQLGSAAGARSDGSLETQKQDSGASFHGGKTSVRPNLTAAGADSGLSPAPKAEAKPASEEKAAAKETVPAPGGLTPAETRQLKLVRAGGIAVAAGGAGLMAYAVAVSMTGPIGWAAAAIFFGGMAAYLANRRLNGKSALG